jgi:hypothetical protein
MVGFQKEILQRFHEATQMLCSKIQPKEDSTQRRHGTEDNNHKDRRLTRYETVGEDGQGQGSIEERKGIHHIVEGWVMAGHKHKESKVSGVLYDI